MIFIFSSGYQSDIMRSQRALTVLRDPIMVGRTHSGSGIFPGPGNWDVYIIVGLGAGSEGDPLDIQVLLQTTGSVRVL